jgi:hypothetical protein
MRSTGRSDRNASWPPVNGIFSMKRLCFDTESTYFKPPGSDIGTPAEHREYLRGKRISFRCAVVFDESTGRYQEFDERETSELVSVLSSADELISHSG